MESLAGFVEIGQDAAAVIEAGRTDVVGVYTGSIQTCMIAAFECKNGLVVVHDSGQLLFTDISALVAKHGRCRRLTAIYPTASARDHAERLERMKRVAGVSGEGFRKIPVDNDAFEVAFSTSGEHRIYPIGLVNRFTELPEKAIRVSTTELNNFYIKPGSQSLKIDLQFSEGRYNAVRTIDKTLEQILEIVERQPTFFFNNAALLHAAHQLGALVVPSSLCDVVERYNLQGYRWAIVDPQDRARQASVFNEYLAAKHQK